MPKILLQFVACLVMTAVAATAAASVAAQEELPSVERATIWVGTVRSGEFVRQVRGPAVLERFGRGMHAHVRIAGEQAAAVVLDQESVVGIRGYDHKLAGRVVHMEDRIVEGTLTVIVEITDDVPTGLLPGTSADVTIDVEHLDGVAWVERPAFARSDQTVGIFKLIGPGDVAERVTVQWGLSSFDKIVVVDGLEIGDRIILSDMSRYDSAERVRVLK